MPDAQKSRKRRKLMIERWGRRTLRCYFCEKKIGGEYEVHHVDHDHANDNPVNLAPAHPFCHRSYHSTGRPSYWTGRKHSDETKQKMSESHQARLANEGVV